MGDPLCSSQTSLEGKSTVPTRGPGCREAGTEDGDRMDVRKMKGHRGQCGQNEESAVERLIVSFIARQLWSWHSKGRGQRAGALSRRMGSQWAFPSSWEAWLGKKGLEDIARATMPLSP